ncbi:MAG: GAF domain-containing protein [Elusimicrobia bacterium]|nr:GAF domain-containing protein [Elusimicrobiota bacterium]
MPAGGLSDPERPRARRRDYEKILQTLENRWKRRPPDRGRMLQEVVDALWDGFGGQVYSWCGFYIPGPDGRELILGPCRDKPACSPIALHGVCGRAFLSREPQVVEDVRALGSAYVACDPEDRSEIAIPVAGVDGKVFAVLDVDARESGAFDEEDRRWLERIVKLLGRTPPPRI